MSAYYEDDGNYNASVEALRNAIGINEELLKTSPKADFLLHGVAMNNIKIANALATLGSREKALELNRSGLDYYEMTAKNPNLATAKREMAVTLFYRGTILLSNGDAAQALDSFRQSQAIVRDMQKTDPSNTVLLADLGGATAGVGVALGAHGQLRDALTTLDQSLALFAELRVRDPLYQDLPAW